MMENNPDQIQEKESRPTYLTNLILVVIGIILIITAVIFYPDTRAQIENNLAETLQPTPTETPLPTATNIPISTSNEEQK